MHDSFSQRQPVRQHLLLASLLVLLLHLLLPATGAQAQAPTTQIFLPVVSSGGAFTPAPAPNPDLRFTPNELTLQAGGAISTVVTISPTTSLISATFALSDTLGDVMTSFVANPDGGSGVLTLSAPASADERDGSAMTTVNGTSGDGSKGWVGAVRLTVQASTTARTFFVNAADGNDANDGSQSKPLKTLTKALTLVKAGDTVKLLGGGFDKTPSGAGNGEVFPASGLLVPSGVKIIGVLDSFGFPLSTILGPGSGVGLVFQGDATLKNVIFGAAGFGVSMFANQGKQTLSNIFAGATTAVVVIDGHAFSGAIAIAGTARTTLNAGASGANTTGSKIGANDGIGVIVAEQASFAMHGGEILVKQGRGVFVRQQSLFTLDGGKITRDGNLTCPTGFGIQLAESAQATVKSQASLTDLRTALFADDNSKATLISVQISKNNPVGCFTSSSLIGHNAASITIENGTIISTGSGPAIGIDTDGSVNLTLKNTTISGHTERGVSLTKNEKVIIDGGLIRGNKIGINASADETHRPSATITNVTIVENQVGIHVDSTLFASLPSKLRNSQITGNGIGIEVGSAPQGTCFLECFDLGTATDPGGNTISGNTTTGVFVDRGSSVDAVGNIWNPNTQASGFDGKYAINFVVRGDRSDALARGKNFFLNGRSETVITVSPLPPQ